MQSFMHQAIQEAKKGWPEALPNPLVGCVIVYDNKIIATGYHQKFGSTHAEVNAIAALPKEINPAECTLYVSLEPCSHFGKTPPCANLIIDKGFKKVVIAMKDPNPLVSGRGIALLEAAGIAVECGIEEEQARTLNPRFLNFHEKKRPFITLKWAQSADGFISRSPLPARREDNLISGHEAHVFTHQLRANSQAILVGKNTVLADNPQLTTRVAQGKNPIRIFIDKDLEVPSTFNVYNAEAPTFVLNAVKETEQGNIRFIKLDFTTELVPQIITMLYQKNVQSLLVEGGSTLLKSFFSAALWDEVLVIENPHLKIGNGLKAPSVEYFNSSEKLGQDTLLRLSFTEEQN
jgi:diaminohydroxyphosphoribosylaminopyrimidine deaminase/5-amino-6-(5-phosphoribosylamino)uracil reductase